jgi:predicted ABC-type ATPase
MAAGQPTFWLIAGPNGVGKTTYAMRHLKAVSGSINFVNLDEIARGLSPLEPAAAQTEAARIALARARNFVRERATFAMETTLSGRSHLQLLQAARADGLSTAMLYFSVNSPAICLERIARRVAEGGHDVPEPVVRRRFDRSHGNLPRYAQLCDLWRVYDASGARPALAVEGGGHGIRFRDSSVVAKGHPALAML